MTWHTHIGDRTLTGIEAEVYLTAMQHAIDYLQDAIEYDDDFDVKTEEVGYFYRRLVWRAFEEYVLPNWKATEDEYEVDEEEAEFSDLSENLDLWRQAIEDLIDRIFWDRDWMVTWTNPQVLDGIEDEISKPLGLDDYFTNRLPKVSAQESALPLAQRSLLALDEIRNWKLENTGKK